MRCWYRQGYIHDISVPLYPQFQADESLRGVSATSRRFFVTFKGKFYMERGSYIQDCHFCSFKKLNLHRLSLTQCHIHPKDKKKKLPTFAKEKQQLQLQQLMNTTFALVPEGSQPASYRRAEAVSAGCIPVFIASDGYVRSFEHDIDWNSISISFEDMTRYGQVLVMGKKNVFQRVNILKTQLVRNSERPTRDSNVHY